jgi:hypothetical protein
MKPVKIVQKRGGGEKARKSNRGGKFDQSTLYACVEMS